MNSREIVQANMGGGNAPRPGMTFDRGRLNDMAGVGCPAPSGYRQRRWVDGPVEYYDDVWGNLWVRMKDGSVKGEIHQPCLTEWSRLNDYQPPHYDLDATVAHLRQGFAKAGDRFRLAHIGGWIFDSSRYLRKLEVYLMDMALHPDELRRLHRLVGSVYETKIRAAGEAGADGIMIGEDMGTQTGLLFSPDMWREYFRDEYTRLFAMAHDYGMKVLMHSCGMNWQIVPDLLAAGIDCFQFDQPAVYDMPLLAAALRQHGAALWSPVDIQQILPTGDRSRIVAGARQMCRTFAGSLICKNYPDLPGIGVLPEWDQWAYEAICEFFHVPAVVT